MKPLLGLAILAGIGYGAFVTLNKPATPEPQSTAPDWNPNTPAVSIGNPTTPEGADWKQPPGGSGQKPVAGANASSSIGSLKSNTAKPGEAVTTVTTGGVNSAPPLTVNSSTNTASPLNTGATPVAPIDDPFLHPDVVNSTDPRAMAGVSVQHPGDAGAAGKGGLADAWPKVDAMLKQHRLAEALAALTLWHDDPRLTPAEEAQLSELLNQLAGTVIYSREHLLAPAYKARAGDTLESIAKQYSVPAPLLANINGVPTGSQIPPGTELKVLQGPFEGTANLSKGRLTLRVQGMYAGTFPLTVGAQAAAFKGEIVFQVNEKNDKPTFSGPDDRLLQAGDPGNPLGRRWLSLASPELPSSEGEPVMALHGSADAERPNRAGSTGFLSLSPRDADDVFDILAEGSKVTVRR